MISECETKNPFAVLPDVLLAASVLFVIDMSVVLCRARTSHMSALAPQVRLYMDCEEYHRVAFTRSPQPLTFEASSGIFVGNAGGTGLTRFVVSWDETGFSGVFVNAQAVDTVSQVCPRSLSFSSRIFSLLPLLCHMHLNVVCCLSDVFDQ